MSVSTSTPNAAHAAGEQPRLLALAIVPVACVAGLYWSLAPKLAAVWDTDPNYSHGYFVPIASAAFAWMIWRDKATPIVAPEVDRVTFFTGAAQLAFGLVLQLAMWFVHNLFMQVLSLIIVIRGMLLMLGGKKANTAYKFPALFLLFMAPLPLQWYQPFAIRMQQLVSDVSTVILKALGVPVYQEGYFVFLPGYTMEIAEACSGLRQLIAILALGVAIGHLSGRGAWFRWTLGLVALPIAIAANCLRVVISGLILITFGPKWAEGVYHTMEGLAIIGVSALLLVGVALVLARMEDRRRSPDPATSPGNT